MSNQSAKLLEIFHTPKLFGIFLIDSCHFYVILLLLHYHFPAIANMVIVS